MGKKTVARWIIINIILSALFFTILMTRNFSIKDIGKFYPYRVAFSPSGDRVTVQNSLTTIFINSIREGHLLSPYLSFFIFYPPWSPDGRFLVVLSILQLRGMALLNKKSSEVFPIF